MSNITIEQVEKLQARANISYEEAKEALEKCDGDILEALIQLEKEGKTKAPGGGTYKTSDGSNQNTSQNSGEQAEQNFNQQNGPGINHNDNKQYKESDFSKQAKSVWKSIRELIHKGNINHFVVSKNQNEVLRMPINVLLILLLIFNGAALIALIVFLFLGYKYSFEGPNLGKQSINNVMTSASNVADDIKESVQKSTKNEENGNGPNQQ